MKKILIPIAIIIVVVLGIIFAVIQTKKQPEEIKIGAILILTGPDAKAGQSAKRGIDMAVNEVNERGGINDKSVKIIYEDDQGDPSKAVSVLMKLINVDKVPAIIGPMWSSSVLAVAPMAEKRRVVILTPTASSPKITDAGDFIFRNTYSDVIEGQKMAEYAYNVLGYKRVALLYNNSDYGVGLKDSFKSRFIEIGGKITGEETYDPKATDFRSQIGKLNIDKPDAIYLAGYNEMGLVLRQAREQGIKIPFLSCIMFEIGDVIKVAGNAAEGVIYAYPSYDPESGSKITREFAQRYMKIYGEFPDPEAAFSYDAAGILLAVIRKVGAESLKIKESLYQIKDYEGVTGKTGFDSNGDVVKSIGFKKVAGGKPEWITYAY